MTPPTPAREVPFVTEGRRLVLLAYATDTTPAWHRPLCVADDRGAYVATAVQTLRQVHVLKGSAWLRYPLQRVLVEQGLRPGEDT